MDCLNILLVLEDQTVATGGHSQIREENGKTKATRTVVRSDVTNFEKAFLSKGHR